MQNTRILDLTAGRRAMWVNPKHPLCTYVDERADVSPDLVADAVALPFPDAHFDIVVFDPPHGNLGHNSQMARRYGALTHTQIRNMVTRTGCEAHRVTKADGMMVLKWSDRDLKVPAVIALLPQWEPLFGHCLNSRATRNHEVHWMLLRKGL